MQEFAPRRLRRRSWRGFEDDAGAPIRDELFSVERLAAHAAALARQHRVQPAGLLRAAVAARAQDNGAVLRECFDAIGEAARQRSVVTPAAEWILDNFHVVDEQLKWIAHDCTPAFLRSLPVLQEGALRNWPRVYALLWDFVAHTDSRFDPDALNTYLQSYQSVQPLLVRELWAVPVMLRCLFVENLRRCAAQVVDAQGGRRQADTFADEVLSTETGSADALEDVFSSVSDDVRSRAFLVQLLHRLRDRDAAQPPLLARLSTKLADSGIHLEEWMRQEHSGQAAANLTVRNLVTSMRAMAAIDWQGLVETVSVVDACLRRCPAFVRMDYPTRDRYRHAVEELAKNTRLSELDTAQRVVHAAQSAPAADPRMSDPGYLLIGAGRAQFERDIGYRPSLRQRFVRAYVARATVSYLGSIALLTALLLWALLWASSNAGVDAGSLVLLGLLAAVPVSQMATTLINRWITGALGPRHLPRLELAGTVPSALRTFVVVPTILQNDADVAASVRQLEVHFLSNPGGDVRFALLSDGVDADQAHRPEDDALITAAAAGIARLNRRYGPAIDAEARFFLFHRGRQWSQSERKWMGWERKRGKLHEFNRLLRGAQDTSFLPVAGMPPTAPSQVRYVVTLDADTRLPIGAVGQLVGAAAHPLNAPLLDATGRRVVEGYAILQPRVTPKLPAASESSLFQRLYSAPSGVDLYAGAVSDVYQDLFGEGSFTGKGIYDVDAFEASEAGRLPAEAVLSHDLLESAFARCALVSDIELFEDFPYHAEVATVRSHRWARGDWQLLPWIFGKPGRGISAISRWKMLDNLRRSLLAPTALATLVASWSIPHAPRLAWLLTIVAALSLPVWLGWFQALPPALRGISLRHHLRRVAEELAEAIGYSVVALATLSTQAWVMCDAIARTLYRLVRRRNLLEWVTAAQVDSTLGRTLGDFLWPLRSASLIAIVASACVLTFNRPGIWFALPMIVLWWLSPLVARMITMPLPYGARAPLEAADTARLRRMARRTWRFFTSFVTEAGGFLPPDNFQEDPQPVIAQRSSPTNLSLSLLASVTAHDLGWIGLQQTALRLAGALDSIKALERYRGHLYNWYDLIERKPLWPRYISSVDSGNLAGHLLALEEACHELLEAPVLKPEALQGLRDDVHMLQEALQTAGDERRTQLVSRTDIEEALRALDTSLQQPWGPVAGLAARWSELEQAVRVALDALQAYADERAEAKDSELRAWAQALRDDFASHGADVALIVEAHRAGLMSGPPQPEAVTPLGLAARYAAATADPRSIGTARLEPAVAQRASDCQRLVERLEYVAQAARALFEEMDFGFLFDRGRKLFSVGYRVDDDKLDDSYYDLLASEARLTSLIAIARGDVPVSHWFRLGRPLRLSDDGPVLVSWSGSMFEYLMPCLVTFTASHSLLDQTCRVAVKRQIAYGRAHGVPWGISESAYSRRDGALTYQYSAFGVPELAFKRGLHEDLVIAPYATALAAMYDAQAAGRNFDRLEQSGGMGAYGWCEALDYTPARVPEQHSAAMVRTYMAHHQGMSLVAIGNTLRDSGMRRRFHRHPLVEAAELLLQERPPRNIVETRVPGSPQPTPRQLGIVPPTGRAFHGPRLSTPTAHLLSNGRYSVMLSTAASGYSRREGLDVTRWREDPTCDCWGTFFFLRDTGSGAVWSAGLQPVAAQPDRYEVTFYEDRARFARLDEEIETILEIVVSPEDDAESRRLTLRNHGSRPREVELTSYAEVVLAPPAADAAHPAFLNLFVQTEYVAALRSLIAQRRPRDANAPPLWAAHVLASDLRPHAGVQYETDRARFIGRGHSVRAPLAVMDGRALSNSAGAVLDPVFSLRIRLQLPAEGSAQVVFSTLTAPTREQLLALCDKYHDPSSFERAASLAWTHAQVQLHDLGVTAEDANLFQHLADALLYASPALRPPSHVLERGAGSVRGLWEHGISGDLPIVLLRVDDVDEREIIRQMLRAHEYWRTKQFDVDLVVLNEKPMTYAQDLQVALEGMVRASPAAHVTHARWRGRVFALSAEVLSPAHRALLQSAARVVLVGKLGTLAEQVLRGRQMRDRGTAGSSVIEQRQPPQGVRPPVPALEFFNGLGGFADGGREYVIVLGPRQRTPRPWVNVIANPEFGFLVSETGAGYTWWGNARENQITPWSNDPVCDPPGEALYLQDLNSGALWTPTPGPIRLQDAAYVVRHGAGYSSFEHESHGIHATLTQFVVADFPVKLSLLRLANRSAQTRRIAVVQYVEWVLGPSRAATAARLITQHDAATGALLARNPFSVDFAERVAFVDMAGQQNGWTCDRLEFLGRGGSVERPAALLGGRPLARWAGAGRDPCAALRSVVELAASETRDVVVLVGQADSVDGARALVQRMRRADAGQLLEEVKQRWNAILGKVQVRTPDPALDVLLNRWLVYQALVCRIWGRTAFYQAGGAFGFRDQLQDCMAMTLCAPQLARAHLLRAAAHQFVEGDVQHWWHPPSDRGVRTHFSDDLLWLPFAVAQYVEVTGDDALLDERVTFLTGPPLPLEQEDHYFEPQRSGAEGSIYEHCARAIERSLQVGAHGLPLMGGGDWNDGMNRVGHHGKGESVWVGWFLCAILPQFATIARTRGEPERAQRWDGHAENLRTALEQHGWDGAWYRRAYFDDGTPLGTAAAAECRIDSIAQSWSVLSRAADPVRARQAMQSVAEYLLRPSDDLVLLLTPPFNSPSVDPGYIRGYLPGVRENGGQYNQAAVWCAIAFCMLGEGTTAHEILNRLNPIQRAASRAGVNAYMVEPYVLAADVYSEPPHSRRGGWTWYTGTAGWMYRAGIEWLLGLSKRGDTLTIDPCLPAHWPAASIEYRHGDTRYVIEIENPDEVTHGVKRIELDGEVLARPSEGIALTDDHATHHVRVVLGSTTVAPIRAEQT